MKKKVILRCLVGAPIGLTISTLIAIIISIAAGDGNFYPVVPELTASCENEINAVVIQSVCSLLYGAAWGGASVIYEYPKWSMLRMTVTHLMICSVLTLPAAYVMWWMPHEVKGIVKYFAIFLAIYVVIWITQFLSMKKKIEQMNNKLNEQN